MDSHKIIGSFNTEHLELWILEQRRRLSSPWKIAGHTFLLFESNNDHPYVYRSLANVHVDSVADLDKKFPNSFIVLIISEVFSVYGKPKLSTQLFPTMDLVDNNELKYCTVSKLDTGWNFSFNKRIYLNDTTFSSENVYLTGNDFEYDRDSIKLNFDEKKIISDVIVA